jgi:hypothetical protein
MGVLSIGEEMKVQEKIMLFDKILEVAKTFMPLITGIGTAVVTGFVLPGFLDRWAFRKIRRCYRSLLSNYNKFCRSLGSGTGPCTVREVCFDKVSDIEELIKKDQDKPESREPQEWMETNFWQCWTALNAARVKAGLESRQFYFSRYFLGKNDSRLLVVLIVKDNSAEMRAFCRGKWEFPPKTKTGSALRQIKARFFGYDRFDYSIMLV